MQSFLAAMPLPGLKLAVLLVLLASASVQSQTTRTTKNTGTTTRPTTRTTTTRPTTGTTTTTTTTPPPIIYSWKWVNLWYVAFGILVVSLSAPGTTAQAGSETTFPDRLPM